MTDIMKLIERLYNSYDAETLCADAARAIEALQGENERLRDLELTWRICHERSSDAARDLANERDALAAKLDELQRQEPVAVVDANDDGYWADILPDRDVKVGQQLFAAPKALEPLTDIQSLQAVSDEYNAWIRYHAAGGDYDGFLKGVLAKQQVEDEEDDVGADCTPNHNCNGRMVHLPDGEHCDHCGIKKGTP